MTDEQRRLALALIHRVLALAAGGWRSDAKSPLGDLVQWAEAQVDTASPDGARLHAALRIVRDFDRPWERRCDALAAVAEPWVDRLLMGSRTP